MLFMYLWKPVVAACTIFIVFSRQHFAIILLNSLWIPRTGGVVEGVLHGLFEQMYMYVYNHNNKS